MVTDKQGYIHLIEYLTNHLSLFEAASSYDNLTSSTVIETIEDQLSEQIINVCMQNDSLTTTQRNTVVREVDLVLSDLEEVLSAVLNNTATQEQVTFIEEFSILIKNLFDEAFIK